MPPNQSNSGEPVASAAVHEQLPKTEQLSPPLGFEGLKHFIKSGVVTGSERAVLHALMAKAVNQKPEIASDPFATLLAPFNDIHARLDKRYPPGSPVPQEVRDLRRRVDAIRRIGTSAVQAETIEERDAAKALFNQLVPKARKQPKRKR